MILGPLFFGDLRTALAMILPVVVPFNLIKGRQRLWPRCWSTRA